MTHVGLLTELEKNELVGKMYTQDSYFNPIQDEDENWIISVEEINQCDNVNLKWVKTLPIIEYKPKPTPPLF
jgi:hypothetical protein